MKPEVNTLINQILIGAKLNALKLTLSDKQLEVYNNHLLDEVKKIENDIIKFADNSEQADAILKAFLI